MTAVATKPTRKQFTVEEYYQLGELGMLGDGRTELIDGDIVYMAPIGSRHAGCVIRLNGFFSENLRKRALVAVQSPVRLNGRLDRNRI